MTWLQALAVFAAGAAAGALLLYFALPARRQYGRLMRERDEARQALSEYRRQVDHHFVRTAELVNQMTESYRQVHEHLSHGARDLCSETGRRLAADASLNSLSNDESLYEDTPAETEPPLDYAPSARGMLSEEYGLDKENETPFQPVDDLGTETDARPATPPRDYAAADDVDGGETQADSRRG